MNELADYELWLGVLLPYTSHDTRSCRGNGRLVASGTDPPVFSWFRAGLSHAVARSNYRLVFFAEICHKRFGNHNCDSLRASKKAAT
jgi:hypothetical protein